jgi:AraC-like DNA-binding protein
VSISATKHRNIPHGGASISTRLVPLFLRRLQTLKLPVESLMKRFGLRPSGDQSLSLRGLYAFSEAAAELARDPFFGLNSALTLSQGSYDAGEYIVRSCPDVRSAFKALTMYPKLLNERVELAFHETPSGATFTTRISRHPLYLGRHGNEHSIAVFVRSVRMLTGQPFIPRTVWFAHPRPRDIAPLRAFLDTDRIHFDQGFDGISLSLQSLSWPLKTADPPLRVLIEQLLARAHAGPKPPDDVVSQVKQAAHRALAEGRLELESVSQILGLPPRTLQRRLHLEQTSFQEIVDEVRAMVARVYLDESHASLQRVSRWLGFSDSRTFKRAFKRWTGLTPSRYLARLRAKIA